MPSCFATASLRHMYVHFYVRTHYIQVHIHAACLIRTRLSLSRLPSPRLAMPFSNAATGYRATCLVYTFFACALNRCRCVPGGGFSTMIQWRESRAGMLVDGLDQSSWIASSTAKRADGWETFRGLISRKLVWWIRRQASRHTRSAREAVQRQPSSWVREISQRVQCGMLLRAPGRPILPAGQKGERRHAAASLPCESRSEAEAAQLQCARCASTERSAVFWHSGEAFVLNFDRHRKIHGRQ